MGRYPEQSQEPENATVNNSLQSTREIEALTFIYDASGPVAGRDRWSKLLNGWLVRLRELVRRPTASRSAVESSVREL